MAIVQEDVMRGREALTFFHNASIGRPGYTARSVDELAKQVYPTNPQIFLDGFGFQIKMLMYNGTYDFGDVISKMEKFASQANGKVPTMNSFSNAITSIAQGGPTVLSVVKNVAVDSAVDIAKGTQAVGNAVISTGNTLLNFAPMLIILGVITVIAVKSGAFETYLKNR